MVIGVSGISFLKLKEDCIYQTSSASRMTSDESTSFFLVPVFPVFLVLPQTGNVPSAIEGACSAHYLVQPTLLWLKEKITISLVISCLITILNPMTNYYAWDNCTALMKQQGYRLLWAKELLPHDYITVGCLHLKWNALHALHTDKWKQETAYPLSPYI